MNISIIYVNYNGLQYTQQSLESLYRFHNSNTHEVIVVDNNSSDGSQEELPKLFPQITFIPLSENMGFGAANNIGAKNANGECLFFVNNDTLFTQEMIEELAKILSTQKTYGIVGPKLLNEDSSFQLSFGDFPSIRNELTAKNKAGKYLLQAEEEPTSSQPIVKNWITGAAFMIKKKLFDSIGGFDEQFFMYFEDIDLCKRLNKKGYHSIYIPSVSLVHLGGKSYGKKNDKIMYEYRRSQLRYYDKHNSFDQRILVRIYILFKFVPKLFSKTEGESIVPIIKLVLSTHNLNR